MTHSTKTPKQEAQPTITNPIFMGGAGFDWLMAILSFGFAGGIYLDGWAHDHGLVDQTFFTPWHALLYSAYGLCALTLVGVVIFNRLQGKRWRQALPSGYGSSFVGVFLFIIAGVGDEIWHTFFGFEVGIEPLLSPSHLLLAYGGVLIMGGPFHALWWRSDLAERQGWTKVFPALLSGLSVFSIFTFLTEFAHPFVHTHLVQTAHSDAEKSWGAASVLLQAGILMGFLLILMQRFRLPVGAFTFIFTLNVALMSVLTDQQRLIPGILLAGIFSDLLAYILKPSEKRLEALRLFVFCIPLVYFLCYFMTLMFTGGITWSIHLWLGSSVITGIIGLMLSFVLIPTESAARDQPLRMG
jgi:hypothetical protein